MCAMLPPGHIHILVTLIFSSDFLGFFLFMLQTGCFVPSYFAAHRSSRPLWPCSQDVIFFSGGRGGEVLPVTQLGPGAVCLWFGSPAGPLSRLL